MRFICDRPDRIPARLYSAVLRAVGGCPCCAFWRGAVLGFVLGIALRVFL